VSAAAGFTVMPMYLVSLTGDQDMCALHCAALRSIEPSTLVHIR
jgi:hypothetical protein